MRPKRDFMETIKARIERDPAFREELLKQGVECLLSGDAETGKAVLRDCINATIGFHELGGMTEKSPKSLMRMFGPAGNPQARYVFEVISRLQEREDLHLKSASSSVGRMSRSAGRPSIRLFVRATQIGSWNIHCQHSVLPSNSRSTGSTAVISR